MLSVYMMCNDIYLVFLATTETYLLDRIGPENEEMVFFFLLLFLCLILIFKFIYFETPSRHSQWLERCRSPWHVRILQTNQPQRTGL